MHETWKILRFQAEILLFFVVEIFHLQWKYLRCSVNAEEQLLNRPHLHYNVWNATNFYLILSFYPDTSRTRTRFSSPFSVVPLSLCFDTSKQTNTHKTKCKYLERLARVLISIQIHKHSDVLLVGGFACSWLLHTLLQTPWLVRLHGKV